MARRADKIERPQTSLYQALNRSVQSGRRPDARGENVHPSESWTDVARPLVLDAEIALGPSAGGTSSTDLLHCDQNLKLAQKEAQASREVADAARLRQREARLLAQRVDIICERERVSILSMLADIMGSLDTLKNDHARKGYIRHSRQSLEEGYEDLFQVSSGHVYIGRSKDLLPSGYGLYIFPTGAFYEGQWSDGMRTGFGRSMSRNTWGYKGEFRYDLMNGRGAIDCFVDDLGGVGHCCLYEGEFLNGMRHGYGAMTLSDGTVILARHESDRILMNNVAISYPDGSHYEGATNGHLADGGGILHFADGTAYADRWLQGRPSGHGVTIGSDGTCIARLPDPDGIERPGILSTMAF